MTEFSNSRRAGFGSLRSGSAWGSLALGLAALALPTGAFAQSTSPDDEEPVDSSEIVVTGTLIRGIAPPGTNTIGISEAQVEATGATTTTQLLQTIPQSGSFNDVVKPTGGGNFLTTNRPNLRNLTTNTSGGSATLMLIDGHRITGMGTSSTVPDLDVIAPGAIERVEIIPDGGSAIYGADAVAGVLNFITRKRFDGVEADARYGFGDDYHTFDANATVGKDWGSGSIFATYSYAEHDAIFGRDRDYVRSYPTGNALLGGQATTELQCPGGNLIDVTTGLAYGLPLTPNAAAKLGQLNSCDLSDDVSIYPKERRHSVFAGLTQQLDDKLKFEVSALYFNRQQRSNGGLFAGNSFTTPLPQFLADAFFPFLAGQVNSSPFAATNGVSVLENVNWAFSANDDNAQRISIKAWGVTPTFTYDLGSSWQARLLGSYSESESEQHTKDFYTTTLPIAIQNGLFNPYAPLTSTGLPALLNNESFGLARQRLTDLKLIFDGDLVQLPGGAVKLAIGAEYTGEAFITQRGNTAPGAENSGTAAVIMNGVELIPARAPIPRFNLRRNTKSAFAELVVPVFGADNATGGFEELTLSVSGRYDDYSDFGTTFNPKFGITWKPADWVKLRGAWGTSYSAPSLADNDQADPVSGSFVNGAGLGFFLPQAGLTANGFTPANGYSPPSSTTNLLVLLGGTANLKPQTATTWSAGVDLDPLPGLRLSATYFNIKYKNLISQPPFTNPGLFLSTFKPQYLILHDVGNPARAADVAAFNQYLASVANFATPIPCATPSDCTYGVYDARKRNLGRYELAGIDFAANYARETGFGSVDASVNGTYELTKKQSGTLTSAFVSSLKTSNRFRLRSTLGATVGNLRGQVTWSHSQGYRLDTPVAAALTFPEQTRVGSFNVIDLYFRYDVPGDGALKDLAFTLNVNNVFDQDPPEYRAVQSFVRSANGFLNGNTVGRLIQVGVSKKF